MSQGVAGCGLGGLAGCAGRAGPVVSAEGHKVRHHLCDHLAVQSDYVQQCQCELLTEVYSPQLFSKASGGYGEESGNNELEMRTLAAAERQLQVTA